MQINEAGNILVFDIEGTDCPQRLGDRLVSKMTFYDLFQKIERMLCLFSLAIADVLIINMWSTDVGRHTAANYDLLRDIFEVNLKLFD